MVRSGQGERGGAVSVNRTSEGWECQAALFLAMMGSSVSGIALTAVLSSVHRKMLNVSVGAIVWAMALTVHYCIDASSLFGEPWSEDSFLELAGFGLIAVGQATYSGLWNREVQSKVAEARPMVARLQGASGCARALCLLILRRSVRELCQRLAPRGLFSRAAAVCRRLFRWPS